MEAVMVELKQIVTVENRTWKLRKTNWNAFFGELWLHRILCNEQNKWIYKFFCNWKDGDVSIAKLVDKMKLEVMMNCHFE